MMLAIILPLLPLLSPVFAAPVGESGSRISPAPLTPETTRPVPDVVARHDRKRPGAIVGAVIGSVVGAFIIVFAVLWWRGKGCLDRTRPVAPSPPDSRASCHSASRSHVHVPHEGRRVLGRVTHDEGWHNLPNPTVPGTPSFKSARSVRSVLSSPREKDAASAHSAASSPRRPENRLPYRKAASPPSPPDSPASPRSPPESAWRIPRPRSANSFRSASSSPVKEPYIRASSETSRETRERRVSLQERLEQRERTASGLSGRREDLAEPGARSASIARDPPLNRKPSFTMMLKNSSRVSLGGGAGAGAGAGGYVTTQERLRDQDEEEEEEREWTRGMKPLDVDRL